MVNARCNFCTYILTTRLKRCGHKYLAFVQNSGRDDTQHLSDTAFTHLGHGLVKINFFTYVSLAYIQEEKERKVEGSFSFMYMREMYLQFQGAVRI